MIIKNFIFDKPEGSIFYGFTLVVVLGTGDAEYEDAFCYYENAYKLLCFLPRKCSNIYAGCDALLVPSRFEPCGLTQQLV